MKKPLCRLLLELPRWMPNTRKVRRVRAIRYHRWMNPLKAAYLPVFRDWMNRESPMMKLIREHREGNLAAVTVYDEVAEAKPKCPKCGWPLDYSKRLGHVWISCTNLKCDDCRLGAKP